MGLLVTRNPSMSLPSLWISRSKCGDRTQSTLRLALTFLKPLHELNKAPHGTVPRFGSMSTSAVWCVPAKESNKNKSPNYRFPAYHQCTTYHQFCRFLLFENKMPSVPWKMRSLWSLCSILACREGVSFDKRVRVMNSSRDCLELNRISVKIHLLTMFPAASTLWPSYLPTTDSSGKSRRAKIPAWWVIWVHGWHCLRNHNITSYLTHHTSHLTLHSSHLTQRTSCNTHHTSHTFSSLCSCLFSLNMDVPFSHSVDIVVIFGKLIWWLWDSDRRALCHLLLLWCILDNKRSKWWWWQIRQMRSKFNLMRIEFSV